MLLLCVSKIQSFFHQVYIQVLSQRENSSQRASFNFCSTCDVARGTQCGSYGWSFCRDFIFLKGDWRQATIFDMGTHTHMQAKLVNPSSIPCGFLVDAN